MMDMKTMIENDGKKVWRLITARQVITALSVVAAGLVSTATQSSGGPAYQNGVVLSRALMKGPNNKPIFAEYDSKGNITKILPEQSGDYDKATVISIVEYNTIVANLRGTQAANPGSHVLLKAEYDAMRATGGFVINVRNPDGTGTIAHQAIYAPPLAEGSNSVLVRSLANIDTPALASAVGLILFQSQLDLTDATLSSNSQWTAPGVNSLIISASGKVLYGATDDIGFEARYYDSSDPSSFIGVPGKLPLHPDVQVSISSTLSPSLTSTDPNGAFTLPMLIPPCPGTTMKYDYTIAAGIYLRTFNPASPTPVARHYFTAPGELWCFGEGEGYAGQGSFAMQDAATNSALLDNGVTARMSVPIDILDLDGGAIVQNILPDDMSGLTAAAVLPDPVDVGSDTSYALPAVPKAILQTGSQPIDFNGDGKPDQWTSQAGLSVVQLSSASTSATAVDVTRIQDYAPDFNNEGLLTDISTNDLADTDLYVFRVSTGDVLVKQQGINLAYVHPAGALGALTGDHGGADIQLIMPGPNSGNAVAASTTGFEDWQKTLGIDPKIRGKNVDAIRPDEPVELILINRVTGYMGTLRTTASSVGSGALVPLNTLVMGPPNLKLQVTRFYQRAGEQSQHTVGYQGGATDKDDYVELRTVWLDRDGSPLPQGLDGFTGRLAVVSGDNILSQSAGAAGGSDVDSTTPDHLTNFPIKPGSYLQLVKFGGADLSTSHFYIQVSARPAYDASAFNASGSATAVFAPRPRTWVPVRVPVFDENATVDARNKAIYQGFDPQDQAAVYQWPYRPEMAFSVIDLNLANTNIVVKNNDGSTTTIDLSKSDADLTALLAANAQNALLSYYLSGSSYQDLPAFGSAPQQFIFALGGNEELATIGTNGTVTFTSLGSLNDVQGSDLLALSLYLNSDPSNILWQVSLPGLRVYYKVADDLEEVQGVKEDPSGPNKALPDDQSNFRLLGGMRLELSYLTPEPIPGAQYSWSIAPNSAPAGRYSLKQFTWADPQLDPSSYSNSAPNNSAIYWEPSSWAMGTSGAASNDYYTGTLKVKYTGQDGKDVELDKTFYLSRRTLAPDDNGGVSGSDVAMLENVLWHLGLSPQMGKPGLEGARINSDRGGKLGWTKFCGSEDTADRRDLYTGGWIGCQDGDVSLEGMVRRFQGRDAETTNNKVGNGGQVDIPNILDGVVSNYTLGKIGDVWAGYWKAYDRYAGRQFIGTGDPDMPTWLANGPAAIWQNGYSTIVPPTYTDQLHQEILGLMGLPTTWKSRADLIQAWILHESPSQWGKGSPVTPYRITEGADEFGSIGFAQIFYRFRYGIAPCQVHAAMKLDFFDPAENLEAFAAHTASPNNDCPGGFYAAFGSHSLRNVYAANNGLRGYYPSANGATVVANAGGTGTDDTYELLAKGIAAYNGGTGFNVGRSWPDELKETLRTTSPINNKSLSVSTAYSVGILHANYGLPYRTYIWKGGTYPKTNPDGSPSTNPNAGKDWCFAYGEQEWMAGQTWSDAKALAVGSHSKVPVGRLECSQ